MEDRPKIRCVSWIISYSLFLGIGFLITRGCNNLFNNKQMKSNFYSTDSYAIGITGHVEYTRYNDKSKEIKVYPGLGHRLFDSELLQDLNGDGKIDRIRRNGAEWKVNSLIEILVREYDFDKNKDRFDEADKMLMGLIEKYGE